MSGRVRRLVCQIVCHRQSPRLPVNVDCHFRQGGGYPSTTHGHLAEALHAPSDARDLRWPHMCAGHQSNPSPGGVVKERLASSTARTRLPSSRKKEYSALYVV